MMRRFSIALLLTTGLSACTVGPQITRPNIAAAQAPWIGLTASGPVDSRWWRNLNDARLDAVVDAALAHNLDIEEAEARLREARAGSDAAAGKQLPNVNASTSATETQLSKNGQVPISRIPVFDRNFSLFDAGIDASWEIDLWGGTKRSVQAAQARGKQAEALRDDTRLRVIAEVLRNYADLTSGKAKLANIQADIALRQQISRLHEARFKAGEATRDEWIIAQQRVDALEASANALQTQIRISAYNLALLSAQPPEASTDLLAASLPMPQVPQLVAGGIRSELLQRRPDIRAADAGLAAATADVGAVKAQLYPRFSIIGSIGQQSRSLGDITSGDSTRFSAGPSFSWPIFSAGRIKAQIRGAQARSDAAAAQYQSAVLRALNDSEAAINRLQNAQAAKLNFASIHQSSNQLANLAGERFRRGEDDRIQWLEAQSSAHTAQRNAIDAHTTALNAYALVGKALGGGWEMSEKK